MKVLNVKCVELAVAMDNHNDIESVLVNAGLIRKWILTKRK